MLARPNWFRINLIYLKNSIIQYVWMPFSLNSTKPWTYPWVYCVPFLSQWIGVCVLYQLFCPLLSKFNYPVCWRIIRYLNKAISITIICTSPNDVTKKEIYSDFKNRKTLPMPWCMMLLHHLPFTISNFFSLYPKIEEGKTIHQTIFYIFRNRMHHRSNSNRTNKKKDSEHKNSMIQNIKWKINDISSFTAPFCRAYERKLYV